MALTLLWLYSELSHLSLTLIWKWKLKGNLELFNKQQIYSSSKYWTPNLIHRDEDGVMQYSKWIMKYWVAYWKLTSRINLNLPFIGGLFSIVLTCSLFNVFSCNEKLYPLKTHKKDFLIYSEGYGKRPQVPKLKRLDANRHQFYIFIPPPSSLRA